MSHLKLHSSFGISLRLLCKEVFVWHLFEHIAHRALRYQWECLEDVGFDFLENIVPIFIQKQICTIAQRLITIVEILEVKNDSVRIWNDK